MPQRRRYRSGYSPPTVVVVGGMSPYVILAFIVLIAIILAMVVGGYLYLIAPDSQVAHINGVDAVVANIGRATVTPGPQGHDQVSTWIPWTTDLKEGDAGKVSQALSGKVATAGLDGRISSEIDVAGLGPFCKQGYFSKPGVAANAPAKDKILMLVPGTRYCAMTAMLMSLYGGVLQRDLQTNITVTSVDNTPVTDSIARKITKTQKADVVIKARFGLLTGGIQPGNVVKKTLDSPAAVTRAFLDVSKTVWQGDPNFITGMIDEADNLSYQLAYWNTLAPMQPDGSRSRTNLEKLFQLVQYHFSNPSPDPTNPWPYDNLKVAAEDAAIKGGYTGLNTLSVVIEMPNKDGEFYYLQGLDSPTPQKVIPDDLENKFRDNLYVLVASDPDVAAAVTSKDWLPKK